MKNNDNMVATTPKIVTQETETSKENNRNEDQPKESLTDGWVTIKCGWGKKKTEKEQSR